MLQTTPDEITTPMRHFCEKLCPGAVPQFVLVLPMFGGTLSECFFNVHEHVKENGGSVQYGWLIWDWPGVMLQAEYHAVWRAPDGELLDITPLEDEEQSILFVFDDTLTFDGFPVSSIRVPLSNDKVVRKFAHAHNEMERIRVSTIKEPVTRRGRLVFNLNTLSTEDREQYTQHEEVATRLQKKMATRSKRKKQSGKRKRRGR